MFIALALSGVVLYIFGDWLDKRQRAAREREFKRRYDE